MKPKKKAKYHFIYRSAVTGRIVTKRWAERFPKKSVRERVRTKC